jgi:uncharacterized iron-regulated membrane protein
MATTFLERFVQRPQNLWVRKALFQIHLWVGIGTGLYVLLISLSGSAIVYRRELVRAFVRPPVVIAIAGPRMTPDELRQRAQRLYPEYEVDDIVPGRRADQPVEVWLQRGERTTQRLLNPYTGQDLGNSLSRGRRLMDWLVNFHDNLLSGETGRVFNLIGAVFVSVLCVTGVVIWWPGIKNWRRALKLDWKVSFQRFNFDMHSALGLWSLVFLAVWSLSGIYLSSPQVFNALVDFLQPAAPSSKQVRAGDIALYWLAQLHFGRFSGPYVKALWVVMGLVPAILFATGAVMWWNRVLRKKNIRI